jgi:hypothetical protein
MIAYYGPHLHAAVKCLMAGRPDNAASWIERDLGEMGFSANDYPATNSLCYADGMIWYRPIGEILQCLDGDGI